ncbi:AfsR/SARP family transcriptional regulator [Mangrovihabitans endophyticus]|uniref:DNA-binding transcriptional activator of the SARP family n=1 Tax=Mangrovihabitans endophyticus TaxID=1751298 RepID=A0A8J3BWB0_9ACTN|nr:BTAD domain-containing putative transcriptional regulator [Mangrovihabitans endophyticus]GGK73373.1 hypothetical protein GCM10012284_04050 [Mangrovihabitans endophyticus]
MLFHVLGPVEVHTTGVHRPIPAKPALVLAMLLLHRNAWVTLDQLTEEVWPGGRAPASAVANLQTYVWKLRRTLPGEERLQRRGDAYRLLVHPDEIDADQAVRLAAEARSAAAREAHETALSLVERALGWWRGRPYGGLAWATEGIEDLRLDLCQQRAAAQLALGRATGAVRTLREVTGAAPLREDAWAQLMQTLHAAGRRAEALQVYRRAGEVLATELGVEPGPVLVAARGLVLSGDPAR